MKRTFSIAGAAMALMLAPAVAQADSISAVEGARAKERQGAYLSRQDTDNLRRYGGNDDYGYGYSGGYGPYVYSGSSYYDDDDYGYGPGVSIYVGPAYY